MASNKSSASAPAYLPIFFRILAQSVEVCVKIDNFTFRVDVSRCVRWKISVPTNARHKRRHRLAPNPKLAAGSLAELLYTYGPAGMGSGPSALRIAIGGRNCGLPFVVQNSVQEAK